MLSGLEHVALRLELIVIGTAEARALTHLTSGTEKDTGVLLV